MKVMLTNFSLFLAIVLLTSEAWAKRVIYIPSYKMGESYSFRKDQDGDSVTPPDKGDKIAAVMYVQMLLQNVSNIKQTVKIRVLGGSVASAGAGSAGCDNPAKKEVFVCANGSATVKTLTDDEFSFPTVTVSLPAVSTKNDAVLSVGSRYVNIGMIAKGVYISNCSGANGSYTKGGLPGLTFINASFGPALEITVEEDRGAVTATLIKRTDVGGCAATATYCWGSNLKDKGFTCPKNIKSGQGEPYFVNGGRPF